MQLLKNINWGQTLLVFLVLVILQTALNFGWVWFYSHFINPDGDQLFYEQYITKNRFIVNTIICIPLYATAAYYLAKQNQINPLGQSLSLFICHFIFGLVTELTMGDIPNYFIQYLLFTLVLFSICWFIGKRFQLHLS